MAKIEMKKIAYQNLNEALTELNAQDKGHYYICNCPECEKDEAFIYKNNTNFIQCNRQNNCGERFVIQYNEKVNDIVIKEEKKESLSEKQEKEIKTIDKALKVIQQYGKSDVIDKRYRGLSENTLRSFMVDMQVEDGVKAIFKKGKNIFKKGYAGNSLITKRNLVFPIHGDDGELERMVMRSSIDEQIKPKELSIIMNPSKQARDFFIDIPKDANSIVITEGILDGMSFREVDKNIGVLSLTGNLKTKQLCQYLLKNEAILEDKKIVLALDNDKAGYEASKKISDVLELMDKKHETFLYPMDVKDPNEYLNEKGKMFRDEVSNMTMPEKKQ